MGKKILTKEFGGYSITTIVKLLYCFFHGEGQRLLGVPVVE